MQALESNDSLEEIIFIVKKNYCQGYCFQGVCIAFSFTKETA